MSLTEALHHQTDHVSANLECFSENMCIAYSHHLQPIISEHPPLPWLGFGWVSPTSTPCVHTCYTLLMQHASWVLVYYSLPSATSPLTLCVL